VCLVVETDTETVRVALDEDQSLALEDMLAQARTIAATRE